MERVMFWYIVVVLSTILLKDAGAKNDPRIFTKDGSVHIRSGDNGNIVFEHPSPAGKVIIAGQELNVINSTGPKGEKGDTGSPGTNRSLGIKGGIGDKGEQGPKGDEGERGDQGLPGTNGTSGHPGVKGEPGLVGRNGSQGPPGPPGNAVTPGLNGSIGLKGDQGDPGVMGPTGLPGINGTDGKKGSNGSQGSPGVGEKGDQGLPGTNGTSGPPGVKGDRGDAGRNGSQGPPGLPGNAGTPGLNGSIGLKGDQGRTGPPGPPGVNGPTGLPGLNRTVGEKGSNGSPGIKGEKGDKSYTSYYRGNESDTIQCNSSNFGILRYSSTKVQLCTPQGWRYLSFEPSAGCSNLYDVPNVPETNYQAFREADLGIMFEFNRHFVPSVSNESRTNLNITADISPVNSNLSYEDAVMRQAAFFSGQTHLTISGISDNFWKNSNWSVMALLKYRDISQIDIMVLGHGSASGNHGFHLGIRGKDKKVIHGYYSNDITYGLVKENTWYHITYTSEKDLGGKEKRCIIINGNDPYCEYNSKGGYQGSGATTVGTWWHEKLDDYLLLDNLIIISGIVRYKNETSIEKQVCFAKTLDRSLP